MLVIFKFWIGYLFCNSACVLSCEKILTVKFMSFGDFFVLNEFFHNRQACKAVSIYPCYCYTALALYFSHFTDLRELWKERLKIHAL